MISDPAIIFPHFSRMFRRSATLSVCLCLLLVPALAAQSLVERALGQSIERVIEDDSFSNAFWGIDVIDVATGRVLYERNARKSFVPASNIKLYTTAAALDVLGPDYQYVTTVWTDGAISEDVLQGNVIVRGSGDPSIGGRFHDGDMLFTLRAWADSLRALGINRIEGNIIGDDDVFDDVPLGNGWSWDDEPYWYSAEISGLTFNDNNVDFEIRSASRGAPAEITWEPLNTDYVSVINRTETIHPDSSLDEGYARVRGTNVIEISSSVPQGRTDYESLTITNPTLFFVHVFRQVLTEAGITVDGEPIDVDDLAVKPDYVGGDLMRIASYTSVPLREIVEVINKRSQNLYAEQVLRTIGAESPMDDDRLEPGSARMGVAASINTFVEAGVDTSHFRIADGSGLSRLNLISPRMTTQLLTHMWTHADADQREVFLSSLPVGGIDGTLRARFRTGRAFGNVRAKTGTLSGASSLSGFARIRGGRDVVFSIMVNNFTARTSEIRAAQDEIIELITAW